MPTNTPHNVLRRVVEALDLLGIPYMVGGSMASSAHGIPRLTCGIDLVADVHLGHVPFLVAHLEREFYADGEAIEQAIAQRAPFNMIHLQSMFKVDIFPLGLRPFDQAEFARRRKERLIEELEEGIYVTTPEGIVLYKLEWYRMGGEASERQYRDALGVISQHAEGGSLDWDYLNHWARVLGVHDLLERARREALDDVDAAPASPTTRV
jgi:hypothetical protein